MKMIMEKVNYMFREHWGIIISILFFICITALGIIAFHPSGEKAKSTVFYIILSCAIITSILLGLIVCIIPVIRDTHKENIMKLLISCCVILFFITSLVLSQSVFIKRTTSVEDVPYEVPDNICYITDTGECYHKSWCHYLESKTQTSVSSAKAMGYRACSYCWYDYTTEYRKEPITSVEYNYPLAYFISFTIYGGLFALIILHYTKIEKQENISSADEKNT